MVSIPDHVLEESIVEPTKEQVERLRKMFDRIFPPEMEYGRKPKKLKIKV